LLLQSRLQLGGSTLVIGGPDAKTVEEAAQQTIDNWNVDSANKAADNH
jgi:hypothetical protein